MNASMLGLRRLAVERDAALKRAEAAESDWQAAVAERDALKEKVASLQQAMLLERLGGRAMTDDELKALAEEVKADPPRAHLLGAYAPLMVGLAEGVLALLARLTAVQAERDQLITERDALSTIVSRLADLVPLPKGPT